MPVLDRHKDPDVLHFWGGDRVGFYKSLVEVGPVDPARLGLEARWPELDARMQAAVERASLAIAVLLTAASPLPVARGTYVLLEPSANVVFAVSPSEVSITADDQLFDASLHELLLRLNELVRTASLAHALAAIADAIERRWPSAVVQPPPVPRR